MKTPKLKWRTLLATGVASVCGLTLAFGQPQQRQDTPPRQTETREIDRERAGSPGPVGFNRIGVGVNYYRTIDSLDEGIDRGGFGLLLSYQYKPDIFGFGLDFEFLPDRFGNDAYAPQAYALFGDVLYGGVGIGWVHTDGSFVNNPFYSLRAGLDLELQPNLTFDIHAQYRFESREDLTDPVVGIDTDTIFLGAALRMRF